MQIYSQQLLAPFPSQQVLWRPGATNKEKTKAIALAYIDARMVMTRLDEVVGTSNWQDSYTVIDDMVVCSLGLRFPESQSEWIWKQDAAQNTDVESVKGGFSDAFKRAAVKFGVGRYLYDLPTQWVEIEPYGKSYRFKTRPVLPKEYGGSAK